MFAKNSAQISFVTNPSMNLLKCKICLSMKDVRDAVKEGVKPAQMMAGDIDQLKGHDGLGGRSKPHNRPVKKRRVEGGSWLHSGVSFVI